MSYVTVNKKQKQNEKITVMNKEFSPLFCKSVSIIGGLLCSLGSIKLIKDIS
jgi:hypothetical protein